MSRELLCVGDKCYHVLQSTVQWTLESSCPLCVKKKKKNCCNYEGADLDLWETLHLRREPAEIGEVTRENGGVV